MPKLSQASNVDGVRLEKQSSIPTPPSGYIQVAAKNDDKVYAKLDDSTEIEISAGGTNFDVDADTGAAESVGDGDTVTFTGGVGIETTVSSTNIITVDMKFMDLSWETNPATNDFLTIYDTSNTVYKRTQVADLPFLGVGLGSTDNVVPRTNGVDGDALQSSGVVIDDSDNVTGVVNFAATGTSTLTTVDINGGAIDNVTIGANNAGDATFANCEILTGASGLTFASGGELASQHAVSGTNFVIQTYNPSSSGAFVQTVLSASTASAALAFRGNTPVTRPTITGSRSGATASVLAQILAALDDIGILTDSTTA